MSKPLIWLVGSADDACFAPAVNWLAEQARLNYVHGPSEAVDTASEAAESPQAIVFCALRPGRLNASAVEDLHRAVPFARMALLLGSWCEGEVRSGSVIPGIKRIYWHQWRGVLPTALGLPLFDEASPHLPRTASDADWLEAIVGRPAQTFLSKIVAVCTSRAATFSALADALASGGFQAAWQLPHGSLEVRDANVWLWDGWPECTSHLEEANKSAAQFLLLDFPRLEDRQRALELGIRDVISRPFHLSDLWNAIQAVE